MWRTGGLPPGLTPKLDALQGTDEVVVVAADTLWMKRSVRANGTVVDSPSLAVSHPASRSWPPTSATWTRSCLRAWRDTVLDALRDGRGVIGDSSAELRRLHVGDRFVFAKGRITIGAIVPDDVVAWCEVMVSRDVGTAAWASSTTASPCSRMQGEPTEARLARRIAPLLGPGYRPRVRRPGHATFRRQGDSVWPPVLMKRGFGEFQAYPDPRHPGYLRMHPSFVQPAPGLAERAAAGAVHLQRADLPAVDRRHEAPARPRRTPGRSATSRAATTRAW